VFGLRTEQVREVKSLGYDPKLHVEEDHALAQVLEAIGDGAFSPGEPGRYRGRVDELLQRDPYLLVADFGAYRRAQAEVDALYADPAAWARRAALNIAGMGPFSADRTVAEYRDAIWAVPAAR
jgi:starch phosphorylase